MGVTPRKMIAVLSARTIERLESDGSVTQFKGVSGLKVGDTVRLSVPKDIASIQWKVITAPYATKHDYVSRRGKRGTQSGWLVNLEEVLQ